MKYKKPIVEMVKVYRDTSRGDYYEIPAKEAKKLYEKGKLALDLTNTKLPYEPIYATIKPS